ncbi:DinB family protein [Marinomonas spartinae]|uniref:DinB family protein n=1 Tax=Marinomonas spartinae TaxID=1792290 RepID=A0A1A8TEG4_9GAMM|nr:DinB family protein [Marinomonas spartinae]SBS30221.1 DinB family protein [Marinomonas spartinae]
MKVKSHFVLMADYNQWMNHNLYKGAGKLTETELSQSRGAFFDSIIGTLNHLLVADTIWLKRFAGHPDSFVALDYVRRLDSPKTLNERLYSRIDVLHEARSTLDACIVAFVNELTDQALSSTLQYQNTKGDVFAKNFGLLLLHFFNHQTHHRGQASTLLYQAGIDIGVTDLLVHIPNEAA